MIEIDGGFHLSEIEIHRGERELGVSVPEDYRRFVAEHDGLKPKPNIFRVSKTNQCGVNQFIPFRRIAKERGFIENLRVGWIPIAWAEGGNYVCLECRKGGVFFWDHEDPATDYTLANTFSVFLDMLAPFDSNDVQLKPGQVKSAWIDPEFLKSLDRK